MLTRGKGVNIHVGDLPRRGVGEVVVLSTTPTSSAAMVVFALEDVYAGRYGRTGSAGIVSLETWFEGQRKLCPFFVVGISSEELRTIVWRGHHCLRLAFGGVARDAAGRVLYDRMIEHRET